MASACLAYGSVPDTPRHRVPLDPAGQGAATAALGLLTAGLILGGAAGWHSPATLGTLAGGIAAGLAFWLAEHRSAHPMLPPSFLASRVRAVSVISAGLMGFVFYGTLFVMSLYFQQLRGGSAGAAGVSLLLRSRYGRGAPRCARARSTCPRRRSNVPAWTKRTSRATLRSPSPRLTPRASSAR